MGSILADSYSNTSIEVAVALVDYTQGIELDLDKSMRNSRAILNTGILHIHSMANQHRPILEEAIPKVPIPMIPSMG